MKLLLSHLIKRKLNDLSFMNNTRRDMEGRNDSPPLFPEGKGNILLGTDLL